MRLPFFRFKTLSSKLTITTSLITAGVLALIAIGVFALKRNDIRQNNLHDVALNLSNTALNINKRTLLIEAPLQGNVWHIDKCVSTHKRDSIDDVLKYILTFDQDIVGCGVAFDIEHSYTGNAPYMIYASNDGNISHIDLPLPSNNNQSNDYFWINIALRTNRALWSAPHPSPVVKGMNVCTYAIPVDYRLDQYRVVFFADIPVKVITEIMEQHMVPSLMESLVIDFDNGGYCVGMVTNPERDNIVHITREDTNGIIEIVGDNRLDENQGSFTYRIHNTDCSCFYASINDSGWVLINITDMWMMTQSFIDTLILIFSGFVLIVIILHITLTFVINKHIEPLRKFSDSAIEISKGNFKAALPDVGELTEMSLLHDSFVTMQQSLVKYVDELAETTSHQAFLMGELQIASRIQDDLLPKDFPPFPGRNDINVRAVLIPAKQIGGDLYNYFIRDEKLYFIIADVSGKSVPAAIVMAIACNVFNTIAPNLADPSDIMRELNKTTCSNNEHSGFFITALVGILDLRTGQLKLCNAGHDPAIWITPEGDCQLLNVTPNLPVGVLADYKYQSETMQWPKSARLVMYTDGITDAENTDREFYGIGRLKACIQDHVHVDLATLIETITSEVMAYSAGTEQSDDLTLFAIDYNPSEVLVPPLLFLNRDLKELERISEWVDQVSASLRKDISFGYRLNLVVEEAFTNIVNHAVFKSSANGNITLFCSVHSNVLMVKLCDECVKFDPTQVDDADTNAPLEERPIGGLGISLMRRVTSAMHYEYLNGHNCLTLTFSLDN